MANCCRATLCVRLTYWLPSNGKRVYPYRQASRFCILLLTGRALCLAACLCVRFWCYVRYSAKLAQTWPNSAAPRPTGRVGVHWNRLSGSMAAQSEIPVGDGGRTGPWDDTGTAGKRLETPIPANFGPFRPQCQSSWGWGSPAFTPAAGGGGSTRGLRFAAGIVDSGVLPPVPRPALTSVLSCPLGSRSLPPVYVGLAAAARAIFSVSTFQSSRMRRARCQADFCVMPRSCSSFMLEGRLSWFCGCRRPGPTCSGAAWSGA